MPIITPAYPSMCATHNISASTKAVILRELQRGGDMVDKIFLKQLSWNDLFTRHSFFTNDYKYYLSITASSRTKEGESVWSGLVESKLRHLVGALDRKSVIAVAHPFPKGFERTHIVKNEEEMLAVKNGSTKYQAKGTTTEMTDETKDAAHQAAAEAGAADATVPGLADKAPENNGQTVYSTTYYIGLELKPLEPSNYSRLFPFKRVMLTEETPGTPRSLDISTDSQIFKSTCNSWPGYQPDIMDLSVIHVRRYVSLSSFIMDDCLCALVSSCPTMFSSPERLAPLRSPKPRRSLHRTRIPRPMPLKAKSSAKSDESTSWT